MIGALLAVLRPWARVPKGIGQPRRRLRREARPSWYGVILGMAGATLLDGWGRRDTSFTGRRCAGFGRPVAARVP
jgi:hypothetical protein